VAATTSAGIVSMSDVGMALRRVRSAMDTQSQAGHAKRGAGNDSFFGNNVDGEGQDVRVVGSRG
jgi:hypothetical protein